MSALSYCQVVFLSLALFVGVPGAFAKSKIQGSISVQGKSKSEYSSLAKVTLPEAIAIATKDTAGKILEAALEESNGFLIYEVEVKAANHGKKEFLIDAGDGKILKVKESAEKEEDDGEDGE